jgi:hypothetical protein
MNPNAVWTKMKGDTAPTMEYPFSVIINSDDNYLNGENPEFESLDRHGVEEGLNWATVPEGVDVDVNVDDFFVQLMNGYDGVFAMFGHSYDYVSK